MFSNWTAGEKRSEPTYSASKWLQYENKIADRGFEMYKQGQSV
jgi:hypothetical protein